LFDERASRETTRVWKRSLFLGARCILPKERMPKGISRLEAWAL
jgi:hypothetical protein